MQAVICTPLLWGATARCISMKMCLQVRNWTLWNQKKTKLPSSNEGKATWPLGYLCSGRAVALVRFIFLFRKTRDLKYQMHLEGIRVLHGEKTQSVVLFVLLSLLGKRGSLWKDDRCFCRIYWERDGELQWRADSQNTQQKFLPEWKISTEIRSYFFFFTQCNAVSADASKAKCMGCLKDTVQKGK